MLYIHETHVMNAKALDYMGRTKEQKNVPIIAAWNSVADPYMKQGSHPDIVERVWDAIGSSLPKDSRVLVYGTPALVHPKKGILLAFCCGTSYCIRLTEDLVGKALKSGAKTYQKWTYGGDMDAQRELGADWLFGGWSKHEIEWCNVVYNEIENL